MEKIQGVLILVVVWSALVWRRGPGREESPCCCEAQARRLAGAAARAPASRGAGRARSAVLDTLSAIWPESKVQLFGSLSSGLGAPSSDVDLAVSLGPAAVARAAAAFRADPAYLNVRARTRLPAITLQYAPYNITCDVHFRTEPLETIESDLLNYFLRTDERALNLAIIVKSWAKLHKLINSKYLTSYGMMMLVVFYLQQRSLLPSVAELQTNVPAEYLNGTHRFNVAFEKRNYVTDNDETLYEILGGFFEYYDKFDFDVFIVSPYIGRPVHKRLFEDLDTVPDEFLLYKTNVANNNTPPFNVTALCVQSLLMLHDNCGWRVPTTAEFKAQFRRTVKSYRENDKCSFLKAIGIH